MLDSLKNDAADRIPRLLSTLRGDLDHEEVLDTVIALCDSFRTLAVAALLVDGRPQAFFANLIRAAENWRRYLTVRRKRGWPLATPAVIEPLFGAVAADSWSIAEQIAAQAADSTRHEYNYLDEYLYGQLVAEIIAARGQENGRIKALSDQLAPLNGGAYERRLALQRALFARDARTFESAFADAAFEFNERAERRARMISIPASRQAVERHVWVEGLAWLRLADRLGVAVTDVYVACPPSARCANRGRYAGEWAADFA